MKKISNTLKKIVVVCVFISILTAAIGQTINRSECKIVEPDRVDTTGIIYVVRDANQNTFVQALHRIQLEELCAYVADFFSLMICPVEPPVEITTEPPVSKIKSQKI